MPPRDTVGRSDKGPTRSRRTSAQIKKRGTAKAAASRLKSRIKERRKKKAREAAYKQRMAAQKIQSAEKAAANKKTAVAPGTGRTTGGRGRTVEKPGARAAAAAAAAARSSRSGTQTGRGAAGQRPVTGGRGRTVERPGERAAAIAARRPRSRGVPRVRPQPKPTGMSLSRAKAGLYNLLPEFLRTDNRSGRTAKQQAFHDSIHGADARRKRRRRRKDRQGDQVVPPRTKEEVDDFSDRFPTDMPPEIIEDMPPEIIEDYYDRFPTGPGYGGGMMGGLGGFGYSPALMAYESQQGAGQVPYYMAAARNAMTPNMSPAFMHAARNYDILGGMQRTRARPIEMMSARERAEIMNMGSNFNVPNYNSPYNQPSGQSQFDYFRNMVRDSATPVTQPQVDRNMFPTSGIPTGPGKGAARPMSQDQARAMGSGLASLMSSGLMGMF